MFSSYGVITIWFFSVLFCVLPFGGAGFQFALPSSKLTRLWRPFPQKAAGFLLALPETREETLGLQSELDKVKVKIEWVEAKIERVEAALGGSTETAVVGLYGDWTAWPAEALRDQLTSLNNQLTELQKEKNLLLQQQQVASTSGGGGRPEIKKAWVRVEEGEMPWFPEENQVLVARDEGGFQSLLQRLDIAVLYPIDTDGNVLTDEPFASFQDFRNDNHFYLGQPTYFAERGPTTSSSTLKSVQNKLQNVSEKADALIDTDEIQAVEAYVHRSNGSIAGNDGLFHQRGRHDVNIRQPEGDVFEVDCLLVEEACMCIVEYKTTLGWDGVTQIEMHMNITKGRGRRNYPVIDLHEWEVQKADKKWMTLHEWVRSQEWAETFNCESVPSKMPLRGVILAGRIRPDCQEAVESGSIGPIEVFRVDGQLIRVSPESGDASSYC